MSTVGMQFTSDKQTPSLKITTRSNHRLLHFQFGLPACTWPFCLSALTFLHLTTETKKIFKLPLAKVTYPEKNLGFFWNMKKEERQERAQQEKEELERQQQAAEQEMVLSEKEQLRIHLERMEEGNADRLEARGDGTGSHGAADEGGSEQEVKWNTDVEQVTCANCA